MDQTRLQEFCSIGGQIGWWDQECRGIEQFEPQPYFWVHNPTKSKKRRKQMPTTHHNPNEKHIEIHMFYHVFFSSVPGTLGAYFSGSMPIGMRASVALRRLDIPSLPLGFRSGRWSHAWRRNPIKLRCVQHCCVLKVALITQSLMEVLTRSGMHCSV